MEVEEKVPTFKRAGEAVELIQVEGGRIVHINGAFPLEDIGLPCSSRCGCEAMSRWSFGVRVASLAFRYSKSLAEKVDHVACAWLAKTRTLLYGRSFFMVFSSY